MLRKATKKDKEQWVRLNREIAEFDVSDDNLWGQIDHAKDEELAEVFSDALSNPQQITIFMIEEEGQVILKEIKQLKETIEMTPADRTDLLDEAKKRLSVLEEYAPKMMGEDEIRAVVETVLSELGITDPTAKDKGRIMKELMPRVKGKADGKLVNQIVASMMK